MLILIATPIGNMGDLSPRASEALQSCNLLLCEDTRHTGQLLQLAGITARRLLSFHQFNETAREEDVLSMLHSGMSVGVVSDAGTPGISDPGAKLVERCHEEGVLVTIIPGPCAFASAFALSGFTDTYMQFCGFLPKTSGERRKVFDKMLAFQGVSVVHESPHRVKEILEEIDVTWDVVLVRELTKVHEEVVRCTVGELKEKLKDREVKGECTLVFRPCVAEEVLSEEELLREVFRVRELFACSAKEAIELVAKTHNVSRKELYKRLLRTI